MAVPPSSWTLKVNYINLLGYREVHLNGSDKYMQFLPAIILVVVLEFTRTQPEIPSRGVVSDQVFHALLEGWIVLALHRV
jgi:hypothetical protein